MAMKNIITWLVLAGCIGILQWHGIQFWSAHVSHATGWAWSLMLEGAGLWLWWTGRRALGVCASALLLIGPLYVVSGPLLADLGRAEYADSARQRLIPAAEAKIASVERELGAFLGNSGKRSGWLPPIEAAQARLDAARADLWRLYAERPQSGGLGWRTRSVIALQAVALVLFQISAIFSICELARRKPIELRQIGASVLHEIVQNENRKLILPAPVNGKKRGLGPQGLALQRALTRQLLSVLFCLVFLSAPIAARAQLYQAHGDPGASFLRLSKTTFYTLASVVMPGLAVGDIYQILAEAHVRNNINRRGYGRVTGPMMNISFKTRVLACDGSPCGNDEDTLPNEQIVIPNAAQNVSPSRHYDLMARHTHWLVPETIHNLVYISLQVRVSTKNRNHEGGRAEFRGGQQLLSVIRE